MAAAIIHLAPHEILREIYFTKDPVGLVKPVFEHKLYQACPAIETQYEGEQAAEEMFDLTNNPSRQQERENLYGRGRSVSMGDVVEVNGEFWVCASMGWEKLDD
jgi:hypothetical protein